MPADSDFWIDLKKGESPIRAWDKLVLGGITFPGICHLRCGVSLDLTVAKLKQKLAEGTTPAQYLISMIDGGYAPGRVQATIEIIDVDEWEDIKETLPKFSPRTGNRQGSARGGTIDETGMVVNPKAARAKGAVKGRDAFDIVHPATNLLGISQVIVKDIDIPPVVGQVLTVVIEMWQYFPETPFARNIFTKGSTTNVDPSVPNASKNVKQ